MRSDKFFVIKDGKNKEIGIGHESEIIEPGHKMNISIEIDGHNKEEISAAKFKAKKKSLKPVIDEMPK